jgi:hypothetical protein
VAAEKKRGETATRPFHLCHLLTVHFFSWTKAVARALYRHSGQMKIVSAVLRGSIAFGVKPLKALGYSLLADAVLVLDSLLIRKTAKDIGKASAFYHQVGALILAATMGTVFVMAA